MCDDTATVVRTCGGAHFVRDKTTYFRYLIIVTKLTVANENFICIGDIVVMLVVFEGKATNEFRCGVKKIERSMLTARVSYPESRFQCPNH